jgi:hypothetical protein
MKLAAVAGVAASVLLYVAATAPAHHQPAQPWSIQLIHRIDHQKLRVRDCTRARALPAHRVRGQHYRASGTPISERVKVYLYWRGVARSCERFVLPWTSDWMTAVRVVQRPFPGTSSWLLSCSRAEGGHGGWVRNRQGSGADGWMQFRSGTFYTYVGSAFSAARRRGFAVPRRAYSWYSALGQAVTAGYMRWSGLDASHWSASWGRGCS